MAFTELSVAPRLMAAALPSPVDKAATGAPAGSPTTRYCLRVYADPYSRIETIQCRTREEWAALDLDVDEEWAESGVRVIG